MKRQSTKNLATILIWGQNKHTRIGLPSASCDGTPVRHGHLLTWWKTSQDAERCVEWGFSQGWDFLGSGQFQNSSPKSPARCWTLWPLCWRTNCMRRVKTNFGICRWLFLCISNCVFCNGNFFCSKVWSASQLFLAKSKNLSFLVLEGNDFSPLFTCLLDWKHKRAEGITLHLT